MHYKVTEFDLRSASEVTNAVQYKVGEWVDAPNNTRLFVFDNLAEAKHFKNLNSDWRIFECKIQGGVKYRGKKVSWKHSNFWDRINFYLNKIKKIPINLYADWELANFNAVLVKRVKLTNEIL